jgi:hypothetical protein
MTAYCGANILIVMGVLTIGYSPTGVNTSLASGALAEGVFVVVLESPLQALRTSDKQSAAPRTHENDFFHVFIVMTPPIYRTLISITEAFYLLFNPSPP